MGSHEVVDRKLPLENPLVAAVTVARDHCESQSIWMILHEMVLHPTLLLKARSGASTILGECAVVDDEDGRLPSACSLSRRHAARCVWAVFGGSAKVASSARISVGKKGCVFRVECASMINRQDRADGEKTDN